MTMRACKWEVYATGDGRTVVSAHLPTASGLLALSKIVEAHEQTRFITRLLIQMNSKIRDAAEAIDRVYH